MTGYPYGPESLYPDAAGLRAYRGAYNTRWVSQERFRKALRLHGPGR